jgi:hypothetical protein
MASSPTGTTGGWKLLIASLNREFSTNLPAFAAHFKNHHGPDGNGDPSGTKSPYKFGQFVDRRKMLSGTTLGQFLVDSGRRHWDDSLDLLEYTIKHSLTRTNPKQITFDSHEDGSATKARAVIKNQNNIVLRNTADIDAATSTSYAIDIICPRANLRP